jgi:D-3-phosphoglycerate dehydrogenase
MKILLTSTSFIDTPGVHHSKLTNLQFSVDEIRGPVKESVLLPIISNYDGIICGDDQITANVIKKGSNGKLKVISKYGIGLDKIDLEAGKKYNIPVYKTPGVNHITVAEHILALIFTYYKNIHFQHNITKKGKWKRLIGHEIFGKKIGVLGFGRIGKELAIRTNALGLDTLVYDPYIDYDFAKKNEIKFTDSVEDLVRDIEILCLALPLNEKTEGIINSELLSKAKNKIVVVNTSRALIIHQESLIESLKSTKISAYLTDVLEEEPMILNHPLLDFENVIITPHIGSRTFQSVQRQGSMAVQNLFMGLKKYL